MLSRLKASIDRRFPCREVISEEDLAAGLRAMIQDGLASQAMATLTTGSFLVAFALSVGGSNLTVGLLAAIPFLTQFFQLPAVCLVEVLRRRRAICVIAESLSRVSLLVLAAAAFTVQGEIAVLIVRHWGFFFVLASLIGLYSLTRLRYVHEEGEVGERAAMVELMLAARRGVNNLSTVNGLLSLAAFPVVFLRRKRGDMENAARAYLIPEIES